VGTTAGFQVKIVEALALKTSPSNPAEVPIVAYEHLFCLPLRGHFFHPPQTEGTEATIGVNYPYTTKCQLWSVDMDMIDSLQRQMAEEPYTPYRIKAPHSRLKRMGHPPKKLIPSVTHNVDFMSLC
jgi:hypothetical protein